MTKELHNLDKNRLAILRDKIVKCFNKSELKNLCLDLEIEHENLEGTTRIEMARELVAYCERCDIIDKLVKRCSELRPGKIWDEQPASSIEMISVKFFMLQELAYFTNTPGRYSDHIKFTITNRTQEAIESLKLRFSFPKLENLIEKEQFYRFHTNVNRTDMSIQEEENIYQITYSSDHLLPGDSIEIERACITYAMELPDKDNWLRIVQEAKLKLPWQLFLSISAPQKGEKSIDEMYIDNYVTREQKSR